jgi:hypothetical protein
MNTSQVLSVSALSRILGLSRATPLTPVAMAKSLRVAFFPADVSCKLSEFLDNLRKVLLRCGVEVLTYEQALAEGDSGRVGEGIVLFAPGEGKEGNLAIDHVSSLSRNTVVGILDGTSPAIGESHFQKRVNALVSALVWHMVHVVIYVDENSWTTCNMNGGIETFSLEQLEDRVLYSLIPKLAAPVVPPQKGDFDVQPNAFELNAPEYYASVCDLVNGADVWGKTGLLASQTKMNELIYRNKRYMRIAAAYLSWRTGMSYGFVARQLPTIVPLAIQLQEAHPMLRRLEWEEKDYIELDGGLVVAPKLDNTRFLVRIPEVSALCTRSGCEKTRLNPPTDLVKLTLSGGRVTMGTPNGLNDSDECQPSFDTITIMSHAIGNVIVASILQRLNEGSKFAFALRVNGIALAHWHGFLDESLLPAGYYSYGQANPPVSCSTPQAALFALSGKLASLQRSLEERSEYIGDVHVEPSHGTNITGQSLVELAQLVAGASGWRGGIGVSSGMISAAHT